MASTDEKTKEEFIGMMVHELRAPLSIIHSSADILLRHKNELIESKKIQLIEEIKQASEGMLDIVNDLLDSTKLKSGKFQITKEPNSIKEVIDDQVRLFESYAEESGHTFNIVIAETVPSIIFFDKERIAHVLANFISNAIKFSESSDINVEARTFDGYVKVGVTDHGVGISLGEQKFLFQKFSQVSSRPVDSKQKGTGLGLVVAKGIVELHSGDIGVISEVGKGSTFWFTLPIN